MTSDRALEIVAFDFDVPADYHPVPLAGAEGLDSVRWARGVVDEIEQDVDSVGEVGDIVEQLAELRRQLLSQQDSWLSAAVSIRPEDELSIGCLVTAEQFAMDDDDGPEAFETMLREGTRVLAPGKRTRTADLWRSHSDVGEIVGMFHRFDVTDPGAVVARVEQRTIFGVFPPGSSDMIRFVFTVSDLATFDDMPRDTQAIVERLTVTTAVRA
ncbi:hypothetical protein [Glaciihabitans sp. GrIS 2.15]|uniref:hypothetical protein n=1 Tax=Glaciihabitans sp. GrIS 2.15 TaxID=3071710 RepID=UPI002DFBD07E|nr:hypothetical protein [Glaciihabitans sp. GrIS 2.15]